MGVWDFIFRDNNDMKNIALGQAYTDRLRAENESTYKMLCELIGDEEKKRLDAFLTQSNLLNSLLFFDIFTMGFGCGLRFKRNLCKNTKKTINLFDQSLKKCFKIPKNKSSPLQNGELFGIIMVIKVPYFLRKGVRKHDHP